MKIISSYSFQFNELARPAGLEPAAFCLEGRCSILELELESEGQLDLARGSASYRRGIYWLRDEAKFARPGGDVGLRGTQLRAIKDVKSFRAELQVSVLGDGDLFVDAKINLP